MKLLSFHQGQRDSYGLLSGDGIVDLGRRLGARVRFPASPECFVVPGAALKAAEEALIGKVSPAALASYRLMSSTLMADYVVIDPSLFRHAPDLPDMDTTPADVDTFLGLLWRPDPACSSARAECSGDSFFGSSHPSL